MRCFKHLDDVNMTYIEHLEFALSLCSTMINGSVKTFFHALLPNIYVTSATDTLLILKEKMDKKIKSNL